MEQITSTANSLLHVFLHLPVITRYAVTLIFVSAIIVHLVAYNERTIHDGPSIFTTAGIFFTFLGIAEGLYGFEPSKIDASIPALLEGLKTAFIASVVGVGAALSIKVRFALFGYNDKDPNGDIVDSTIDDLYRRLVSMERSSVEGQASLLAEARATHEDSNVRLESLSRSQEAFLAKMADNNSKALITALQEVIRDFNIKITEQFGDNFKQLNSAVGGLLEWQSQYRLQIGEMIEQQSQSARSMTAASKSYELLLQKADTFTHSAASLSSLITSIETQKQQLTGAMEKLGLLFERASKGLPDLENKIVTLTEQVSVGVRKNSEELSNAIKSNAESVQHMVASTRTMMLEANQSSNTQVNEHIKALSDKTTEQFAKLDQALETELSKSISSLGRQLTALSKQFVDDYLPLTDRLRALVQIGR